MLTHLNLRYKISVQQINLSGVDLKHTQMVGARAQLRVFSAGVWHNIVLGGLAWVANLALPFTLSPLYFHALTGVPALTHIILSELTLIIISDVA